MSGLFGVGICLWFLPSIQAQSSALIVLSLTGIIAVAVVWSLVAELNLLKRYNKGLRAYQERCDQSKEFQLLSVTLKPRLNSLNENRV